MDYNYMSAAQINSLDYWPLVTMLGSQITPAIRKLVLKKLTEMNDRLILNGESQNIKQEMGRMAGINSRNKDISENQHPSLDYNFNIANPMPIVLPNNNYQSTMPISTYSGIGHNRNIVQAPKELTVDDIIDDMIDDSPEQDELDKKLAKIKSSYDKIISDKRRRRKNN